jgi:Protein of unknown function (DUF1573)
MRPGMSQLLALSVLALTQPPTAAPALDCPQPLIDRGEVRAGPVLRQRFTLVNRGPLPLDVVAVRASCHCLEPRLSARQLAPGATADLDFEVNTLSPAEGAHAWRVAVGYRPTGTDIPDRTLELTVTARLVREVSIEPAELRLRVAAGAVQDVTVTDRRAEPLHLTGVHTTAPELRADLAGDWQGGPGHWTRTVRLTVASAPPGSVAAALLLSSDDPDYRELKLSVTLDAPAAGVTALPAEVTFRPVPGQAVLTALVRLRDAAGRPVRVADALADDPHIECRWADGPGDLATLKIQYRGTPPAGARGSVRVRLAALEGQTVAVPWRAAELDRANGPP